MLEVLLICILPLHVEALHDIAYMDMIPFHGTEKQTMMETVWLLLQKVLLLCWLSVTSRAEGETVFFSKDLWILFRELIEFIQDAQE